MGDDLAWGDDLFRDTGTKFNRVLYVSRQFMQNYGDSSAEVYD